MSYYRQSPDLRSGDVPWIKGAKSVKVPVVQRISGVAPISDIALAAMSIAGREPPTPIQEVVGEEEVQLKWARGCVAPDGTPGIKTASKRRL